MKNVGGNTILVKKLQRKIQLWETQAWKDNIKKDLKERRCEDVDWNHLLMLGTGSGF
jgi:hypothetical protein